MATVAPRAAICARARSTKITPRSTTWMPRYAWIPAMIRLAAKGAARNCRMVVSMSSFLLGAGFPDGRDDPGKDGVEELDVVGDLLLASHRGRQDHHLGACLARNG